MLVEGGAGVGKTSLLRAAVAMAGASGLVALQAVAGILEADLGWNLVRQLFGDVILAPEEERAGFWRAPRRSPPGRWGWRRGGRSPSPCTASTGSPPASPSARRS